MTDNLPAVLTELASIEATMRNTPQAYFRNEPMQARYRGLLEQREGSSSNLVEDEDESPLIPIASPAAFAAETGATGGYDSYLKLSRTAADWVFALPAPERRAFVASFEALPDDVAHAALAEIMAHRPMAGFSSESAVAAFAEMPEGMILSREWGGLTARNLATVRERLFRVIDRLDDRAADIFAGWLDALSTGCAIALYRKLAN